MWLRLYLMLMCNCAWGVQCSTAQWGLGSILVNEAIPAPGPAYGIGSNGCEGQVGRLYDDVLHLEKIFIINIVGIMYAL